MNRPGFHARHHADERGGITIVLALLLTVVMGVAAFGLARNSLRELGITGTLVQGTKADKAADAGLDWFITWSHPDNVNAYAGSDTAPGILATTLVGLKRTAWDASSYAYPSSVSLDSSRPWDRAATITSTVSAGATNDMVFDTAASLVKQSTSSGNAVVQKFDLVIRFLGEQGGSGPGDPSSGTDTKAAGTKDLLWQITSRGSANVAASNISFIQTREIIGVQSRSQD